MAKMKGEKKAKKNMTISKVNPDDLRAHVEFMCQFTRRTGSPENKKVRDYIKRQMKETDFTVWDFELGRKEQDGVNILTQLGDRDEKPIFIIGAHHDHPYGPGANDNASGCATLIEVAKRLSEEDLKVTLQLNFYDREETGYVGSRAHAECFTESNLNLLGMFAIDMVGYCRTKEEMERNIFAGKSPSRSWGPKCLTEESDFICLSCSSNAFGFSKEFALGMKNAEGLNIKFIRSRNAYSADAAFQIADHGSFKDSGYPTGVITDTGFYRDPNWHTKDDTPDQLNYEFMSLVAESIVHGVKNLSGKNIIPEDKKIKEVVKNG